MSPRNYGWCLGLALISVMGREARSQAPTIGTELPQSSQNAPGSANSMLGPIPGNGGGTFASPAVGGGQILGGRAGSAAPRVPTSISVPGSRENTLAPSVLPAIPALEPLTEVPLYGTLALPEGSEDGPPDGMSFDQALEILIRENLDLRARRLEIDSARADEITASLRGNPIFYADSQLIPYGSYSSKRPGGPNQYDVNISQPVDYANKRRARMASAMSTTKAIELQYQDAVRLQVANLGVAFVGVVAARETLRYAQAGANGLDRTLEVARAKQKVSDLTSADVSLLEAQRGLASVGILDAEEGLRRAKLALGGYLNLPPDRAEGLEVRDALKPLEPPIPGGPALVELALSCRADVRAYREGIHVARASFDLQKKNRFADAYLLYQPYTFQNLAYLSNTHSATSWALGVTVPLPVFNRNQGNIARARINIEQAELQLRAVQRLAIEQVRDAEREYAATARYLERLDRDVIPSARRAMDSTAKLFEAGEKDVTSYLDVQKRFNDVVRQYRDTAVRHRRSMLGLNTAVGSRILP